MQDDSSDEEPEQLQCTLILLGAGAVGKPSIALRFTEDHFATQYKQTIGLDFFMKRIVLPCDIHIAMQVWDIGGQSIGGKMIHSYIHGAHAVGAMALHGIMSLASFFLKSNNFKRRVS